VFWGGIAGFTSTVAHAGGPPLLVYLLGRGLEKRRFIATTVGFYAVVNVVKLIPYVGLHVITRRTLLATAALLPFAPLGIVLGLTLQRRLPERPFFIVATVLLAASGVKLLWDGVLG
jgi:uncharacterized membrane protein YfcA